MENGDVLAQQKTLRVVQVTSMLKIFMLMVMALGISELPFFVIVVIFLKMCRTCRSYC